MYQCVAVVHGHPLGILQSNHMHGFLFPSLTAHVAHRLTDGFHLCGRIAFTDDELVADGATDLRQVSHDDAAAFFLL